MKAGERPFDFIEPDHEAEFLVYGDFEKGDQPLRWVHEEEVMNTTDAHKSRGLVTDYLSLMSHSRQLQASWFADFHGEGCEDITTFDMLDSAIQQLQWIMDELKGAKITSKTGEILQPQTKFIDAFREAQARMNTLVDRGRLVSTFYAAISIFYVQALSDLP